jgi:hypothetical protein
MFTFLIMGFGAFAIGAIILASYVDNFAHALLIVMLANGEVHSGLTLVPPGDEYYHHCFLLQLFGDNNLVIFGDNVSKYSLSEFLDVCWL